jgi:hypothetical protein
LRLILAKEVNYVMEEYELYEMESYVRSSRSVLFDQEQFIKRV